jgi:hypothetical protein
VRGGLQGPEGADRGLDAARGGGSPSVTRPVPTKRRIEPPFKTRK